MTKGILIAMLAVGVLFAPTATPTALACRFDGAGFVCGSGERVTGYSQPAPTDRQHEAGTSSKTDAPVAPRA